MLGWKILKSGEKKLKNKMLSNEEEELILGIEQSYCIKTRKGNAINEENAKKEISEILKHECKKQNIILDYEQEEYLIETAFDHIFGFCFLQELLEDDEIEEISIIGINKPTYIFHRKKGWIKVNGTFTDEEKLKETINKMAKNLGRRITFKNPRINAVLNDGSRIHGTVSPVSKGELTIRKFREKPFTPFELIENKTVNLKTMAIFSLIMHSDCNVVIAGNTASGKTTTLNSLFTFIPSKERIILIEETPEIRIPHAHQLRLISNQEKEISLNDLIYDSLRMRPDRTIIGEIRNKKEAEAFIESALSGQARGSYCTMHGRSSKEAIQRLKSLGASELDINSIDALIVQRRKIVYDKRKRKNHETREITEIAFPKQGEFFEPNNKKLSSSNGLTEICERLGLSKKEIREELNKREKIIQKSKGNFQKSFSYIQKEFYGS